MQTSLIYFVELSQAKLTKSPRSIFSIFNTNINFIVDTGASCCLIHKNFLPNGVYINTHDKINIRGINGLTTSIGSLDTKINFKNTSFEIKFNVVDQLPSNIAGLLGSDFLFNHKAKLDFKELTLTLSTTNHDTCKIPLNIHDHFTCVISARTEVVKYIPTNMMNTCVVLQQQIVPHVFIANSIAEPINGTIPIRIVNLKNKPVTIENFKTNIKPASTYNVVELRQCKKNINKERAEKLLKELKLNHLPNDEKQLISKICLKYSDIFCLENDKLETTNVYCPSVSVKANTQPVYSKPYRLPVSQKKEVDSQIDKMIKDGIIEKSQSEWNGTQKICQ